MNIPQYQFTYYFVSVPNICFSWSVSDDIDIIWNTRYIHCLYALIWPNTCVVGLSPHRCREWIYFYICDTENYSIATLTYYRFEWLQSIEDWWKIYFELPTINLQGNYSQLNEQWRKINLFQHSWFLGQPCPRINFSASQHHATNFTPIRPE